MFDLGAPSGVVVATELKLYGAQSGGGYHPQSDAGDITFQINSQGMNMVRTATLVSVASLLVNSPGDAPQVGDPAPGLSGETIATLFVQDINASGQVVLSGTTSTAKTAIWQASPGKPVQLIAATG